MPTTLTEDDLYRASTQFRLWSFSPTALTARRDQTHRLALQRASLPAATASLPAAAFLTQDEEVALVLRYCTQIQSTAQHFKFPSPVTATAIQYLKRFYLSNSVLTYPPKEVYKTVLYLATKTEGLHLKVGDYGARIGTDVDAILAVEYKVMQALRFTLEVRKPFAGLKGWLMEAVNVVEAMEEPIPDALAVEDSGKHGTSLWEGNGARDAGREGLRARLDAAYAAAKAVLDTAALLTDAYFLYTPSQISFAALHIADPPLTDWYLGSKLPPTSPARPKILSTVHSCADLMRAFSVESVIGKEERARVEEKLEKCRDPTTRDLVRMYERAKMGQGTESDEEGKKEKKRRAREAAAREGEELFGGDIGGKG
ncbi:cyclin-like protein [Teratosphaeria nubilosa]|uniref:RNA polymerase II holoenzyme cyclin-like subunit n=1 Tax=Teratosphaeria nubilosa TaxID=161662 RepID=A0A6G1L760_9PEZI|nr:cyclin-like protein [Teratosphaeria nubilosa]